MQVKFLAAALCVAFPVIAAAQSSVQVYGVLDASLVREDTGAADGRRTTIMSGNQSSTRLGFRGTEDLGNGLKAVFNLEAGTALDTGMGDSALFGRRAVVGLTGNFGSVMIGREYSLIADIAKETDVFGQGFFGGNLNAFTRLTRRMNNAVVYKTNKLGGFRLGASYSAGEQSTGPSRDLMGVSAEYTVGNLYIGGGYHTTERLATGDDKEIGLGAGYKMGAFEIKGNYLEADPTGANNQFEQMNLGVSYKIGAPHTVFANFQTNKLETGAKGNGFALAYQYNLSKRTNVYATYSVLRNNGKAVFGMNSSSNNVTPPTTALGADPSVLLVGLRHAF